MSLPTRNAKDYLHLAGALTGSIIVVRKQHADELQTLFAQHGVACERQPDADLGRDLLWFDAAADRGHAEQILESYKLAKGS
jgi:hypothetical protein